MSRRNSIRQGMAQSFVAVLDPKGKMVAADKSAEEAYEKAYHASKKGVVVVDYNVYAKRDNPSKPDTKNPVERARKSSKIPTLKEKDWYVDLTTKAGQRQLEEARAVLRSEGKKLYKQLLKDAQGTVHAPSDTVGGIAVEFNTGWIGTEFNAGFDSKEGVLRDNQKLKKILSYDDNYDSIGLSLLPHGASFRDPFSTKVGSAANGATYCHYSTKECQKACLVNTGQRALGSGSFAASYLFSHLVRTHTAEFMMNLMGQCLKAWRQAEQDDFRRFIRLNVMSDVPWEVIAPGFIEHVTDMARKQEGVFSDWGMEDGLAFYDYSKIPYRPGVEDHYDITYSFTGTRDIPNSKGSLADHFADILEGYEGVAKRAAVVFVETEQKYQKKTGSFYKAAPGAKILNRYRGSEYLPWTLFDEPVWNGDRTDIRPLDPEDVRLVGLSYKVAKYKKWAETSGKSFKQVPVVPSSQLDKELPYFMVRVMQPDPEAPPIVVPTQELKNRRLEVLD